jgi:DNA-binding protein H-NS
MKIAELKSMSVDDLWSLHEQVDSILSSKLLQEKQRLERRLRQIQHRTASRSNARRPYPPVYPKYRNPNQPSETWAGRGKQPGWLRAQLRSGKKLDEFRIRPS